MRDIIDDINWVAIFVVSLIYPLFIVVLGDLIINSAGEAVGPITDIVITLMLVSIVAYLGARKTELASMRVFSGGITGAICSLWQVLLAVTTLRFAFLPFLMQTFLFVVTGLISGFAAKRL